MFILSLVFFATLALIFVFLTLKQWEISSTRRMAPRFRAVLDAHATNLHDLLHAGQRDLEKLPPALVHVSRLWLHYAAVGFGHLAHWLGERSHRLADMVSYKHRFERREMRSEFLKKVAGDEARERGESSEPKGEAERV